MVERRPYRRPIFWTCQLNALGKEELVAERGEAMAEPCHCGYGCCCPELLRDHLRQWYLLRRCFHNVGHELPAGVEVAAGFIGGHPLDGGREDGAANEHRHGAPLLDLLEEEREGSVEPRGAFTR